MHLVYDHSPGAYNVRVQCLTCARMSLLSDMVIDRDGPAFLAYYCPTCAPVAAVEFPCNRHGCTRTHG